MKKNMIFLLLIGVLAVIIILALQLVVKRNSVQSVSIEVIGESIIGENYHKTAIVGNESGEYFLAYKCTSKEPNKNCNCNDVGKKVSDDEFNELIKVIATLKDGGETAKCCDHPWTEIEINYVNGAAKKLTVAMEPVEVEKIFKLDCK